MSSVPGESFSGLGATARESVGQLLPRRDPTEQRLAISSRQEDLDIGSGKSKGSMLPCPRCSAFLRDRETEKHCYAPATPLPGRPLPSHGGHIIHRTTMMR
jgi:hypothetical protein